MLIIYEPKGRAAEYSGLAANLYRGCTHGCVYCYGPTATYTTVEAFGTAAARVQVIDKLSTDAAGLEGRDLPPVLLCFTCDPYQPAEAEHQLTSRAISVLHKHGLNVKILTKAGELAKRGILELQAGDAFGATLTCDNPEDTVRWEPGAAMPAERMDNLRRAHDRGIRTWVSLEPVLYPTQTLHLIELTHEYVDEYKVGVLNYHPHRLTVDWPRFASEVVAKLESVGARYYLKRDLRAWLQREELANLGQ